MERALFRDHCVRGEPLADCKRRYLPLFGITARMFNAAAFVLEGKVKAARESQRRHLRTLRNQIRALEGSLAELGDRLGRAWAPGSKWRLRFQTHQKKRCLGCLKARLARVEADLDRVVPPLCFGSGRLFRAQFHLGENGYSSREEWLQRWHSARSSGPGPPPCYPRGIARGTSGVTGGVYPGGCVPRVHVVGVSPREAGAGGYPYPGWHGRLPQDCTAHLVMVYPRSRGGNPRRKSSGELFARRLNNAQVTAAIVEFRGTVPRTLAAVSKQVPSVSALNNSAPSSQ